MSAISARTVQRRLRLEGGCLIKTYTPDGAAFSLDDGSAVPRKVGAQLTQFELFEVAATNTTLTPNEDGLFEGFSQTWSVEP